MAAPLCDSGCARPRLKALVLSPKFGTWSVGAPALAPLCVEAAIVAATAAPPMDMAAPIASGQEEMA